MVRSKPTKDQWSRARELGGGFRCKHCCGTGWLVVFVYGERQEIPCTYCRARTKAAK